MAEVLLIDKKNVFVMPVKTGIYLAKPLLSYDRFLLLQKDLNKILVLAAKDGLNIADGGGETLLAVISSYVSSNLLNEFAREFVIMKLSNTPEKATETGEISKKWSSEGNHLTNYEDAQKEPFLLEKWEIDNFLSQYAFFLLGYYRLGIGSLTKETVSESPHGIYSCSISTLVGFLVGLDSDATNLTPPETVLSI